MPENAVLESRVIDYRAWGAFWRFVRGLRQWDADTFCNLLKADAGIRMTPRVLYEIERGERRLRDEEMIAMLRLLDPPMGELRKALRPAYRDVELP